MSGNEIEIEVSDEELKILRELSESGKPLNFGDDDHPLWVEIIWLDEEGAISMKKAEVEDLELTEDEEIEALDE